MSTRSRQDSWAEPSKQSVDFSRHNLLSRIEPTNEIHPRFIDGQNNMTRYLSEQISISRCNWLSEKYRENYNWTLDDL